MGRLNFRVNFDDPDLEPDGLTIWLKTLAVVVVTVGALGVGYMFSNDDAVQYLHSLAARLEIV